MYYKFKYTTGDVLIFHFNTEQEADEYAYIEGDHVIEYTRIKYTPPDNNKRGLPCTRPM